jgi:hypothetical protein
MKTQRVDIRELDCFEVSGALGDTYHIDVPDGVVDIQTMRSAIANVVLYSKGSADITFERYPGEVDKRSAGTSSIHHKWRRPDPGRVSFQITTETFAYYCIKDKKNRPLKADDFQLSSGASATIAPNMNLFIASGVIEVEGQTLKAPAQVLTTSSVTVAASGDVFGAIFERLVQ